MRQKRWFCLVLPMYIFSILFVLGPLLYMIALSFATNHEGLGVTFRFTLENFRKMADPVYVGTFVQSFQVAIMTTILVVVIGYPFGYFMAKQSKRGKRLLMFLIMVPFWTSSLLRMYGWIIVLQAKGIVNTVLIRFGLIRVPIKILYSYPAVLIGMVYALLPFMILSVYSSVEKMDWTFVEAAKDLGASNWKAFSTVTLKLTLPGLLSGVILTFIPSMGLFFIADILGGNKIVLVGSLIQDQLGRGGNWPFAAALSVILMILTSLMIYLYRRITHIKDLEGVI
ncbi:spermidine/putrescine ABC transporter permease [Lachnospiraceae bacterium oral taxon 096]|nr:spermidine/putrescine ABC transporter permease [Lachnospiraceae bacterium oral taxon 096]